MAIFKKGASEFETPYTVKDAVVKGGLATKLSMIIMGFGNVAHKQFMKGLLYFAIELAYILFMVQTGIGCLQKLISLGGNQPEEVWNEAKGIYEYTKGDMTILFPSEY
mgnify:CR=1 FL=1